MKILFTLLVITLLAACGELEETQVEDGRSGEEKNVETAESEESLEDTELFFVDDQVDGDEGESDDDIGYAEPFSPSDEVVDELYDGEEYDINDIMEEEYKHTRKLSEPVSVQSDSVTTTITDGLISYHKADDYARLYGDDVEEGDMVPVMELDITLENSIEEERTIFIDQLTIVSSDGHQVDASGRLSDSPIKDMLGAVKSHGTIVISLKGANMWESEWIDVHIPAVIGADSERVADSQAVRIYFDEY